MELYNEENASPTITNIFELKKQEGMVQGREAGLVEGEKEGKLEGKLEERRHIAQNLLKQNIPLKTIANATKLTIDEIEALKSDIQ